MPANVMGFGTGYVGRREKSPDGSYTTTEWVILFFLPAYPLRSWRVRPTGGYDNALVYQAEHYEVSPLPLVKRQVFNVYAMILGIPILFYLFVVLLSIWIENRY